MQLSPFSTSGCSSTGSQYYLNGLEQQSNKSYGSDILCKNTSVGTNMSLNKINSSKNRSIVTNINSASYSLDLESPNPPRGISPSLSSVATSNSEVSLVIRGYQL